MYLISTSDDEPRPGCGFRRRSARWPHRWLWSAPRPAHTGHYDRDLAVETHKSHWLVEAIFRTNGGARQALLRSVRDGSVRRTLAIRVLKDPGRFRRAV